MMIKDKKIVYICSPYSGDIEQNVKNARAYSRFAVDRGVIPFAPHLLLPQYMSEKTERDISLDMGLVFLKKCNELWVFGSHISSGMSKEISVGLELGIPIKYVDEYSHELSEFFGTDELQVVEERTVYDEISHDYVSSAYIKEKSERAKRCLEFIISGCDAYKNEEEK